MAQTTLLHLGLGQSAFEVRCPRRRSAAISFGLLGPCTEPDSLLLRVR